MPTAANRFARHAQNLGGASVSQVVDLALARRHKIEASTQLFSTADRRAAQSWAETAHEIGYTRLVFEPPACLEGVPAAEFLLIYARDTAWSSWGIACESGRLMLWYAPTGKTIGHFQHMADALNRIGEITTGA